MNGMKKGGANSPPFVFLPMLVLRLLLRLILLYDRHRITSDSQVQQQVEFLVIAILFSFSGNVGERSGGAKRRPRPLLIYELTADRKACPVSVRHIIVVLFSGSHTFVPRKSANPNSCSNTHDHDHGFKSLSVALLIQ